MATRRISVNVRGLWRTSIELKEEATWYDLKIEIGKVTGIPLDFQKLEPNDYDNKKCKLEEGDDVFCDLILLPNGYHPLHYAAATGNIKTIHSWLASGADVNVTNEFAQTPLMYACEYLKEECVTELLRLGANVQMIDYNGNTALHFISRWHNTSESKILRMTKMLIKTGCNPTTRNKNNLTFIDKIKSRNQNGLATKLEEWIKETTMES